MIFAFLRRRIVLVVAAVSGFALAIVQGRRARYWRDEATRLRLDQAARDARLVEAIRGAYDDTLARDPVRRLRDHAKRLRASGQSR